MAASSNPQGNYHVFLSFRGTDVRCNFLSHLYWDLGQEGIFAYVDSEELRKGEQITPALMKAIEDSRIAIIVFSEDYASSSWCLDELAKIMECKKEKNLKVYPVFYKVEPREVRTPRKSYRQAMIKHERKFVKDLEKVNRWKKALLDAGSLSGWNFHDGDEAELIQSIVKEVSTQLNRTPLHVAKHLVGIDSQMERLISMLKLESNDVLMIGLWGQGGIGKTTLAKAIYNSIFRQFECSSFLARIRETSHISNYLATLQEKLLSEIFPRNHLTVLSVEGGINLIQDRLCCKKALIILDDVDSLEQLNAFAGACDWFGKGSRIIITTRDSHLLTSHGIDQGHIYEVRTLEICEALELFNKHALERNGKIVIRGHLVESALQYANGLPLALEVLGSFLHGRGEDEWESALSKLAKSPNEKINKVLKLSYDGLEQNEKEIFLDIACFFKGKSKWHIMEILDGCDFDTSIGIHLLVEKSLIFEEGSTLQMHDLTWMMGMDIVKQECPNDPGRRSRLWLCDDISEVLSQNTGTDAVKAIVLDLPEPEKIDVDPDAFTNMRRLRLLIMINVCTSFQGPICLPNDLTRFEWPECSWSPPFSSGQKKLVGLDLQRGKIQVAREQFKDYKKLKFINLSKCQSLVCTPDLDCIPNLEELNLQGCRNLECAQSIGYHHKLVRLNLSGCSKLQRFPDVLNENKSLQDLILDKTSIEELPASIENLVSLIKLSLRSCKRLAILPSSIYRLQNLQELLLHCCSKLIKFPKKEDDSSDPHTKTGFPRLLCLDLDWCHLSEVEFLENPFSFPSLGSLNLSGNNFSNLPRCQQLYNLELLFVDECQQLQEILNFPGKLRSLCAKDCKSLSQIPSETRDVEVLELDSCHELVRNGFSASDWLKPEKFRQNISFRVMIPGGEMPKWLLPNKDGYISFMTSKDLYEKILQVAVCVVFRAKRHSRLQFELATVVNCKAQEKILLDQLLKSGLDSDHVWFAYLDPKVVWPVDDFGTNDLSHFFLSISLPNYGFKPRNGIMVKKCGFRLICKPLENNLEVLLQDDQLFDPALLYEVSHEDSPISTEEGCPSKVSFMFHRRRRTIKGGFDMADFSVEMHRYYNYWSSFRNVHPGREMPEQFVRGEDGTVSFMASQGLYEEIQGLVLCVVFGVEDGKKEISFDIVPHVHGQRRNGLSGTLGSFDSDHRWFQFVERNALWGMLGGEVDFGQSEKSYLQFSLTVRVSGGIMKKLGYFLSCRQLDDDVKAGLEDNQLMDPASLRECFLPRYYWLACDSFGPTGNIDFKFFEDLGVRDSENEVVSGVALACGS